MYSDVFCTYVCRLGGPVGESILLLFFFFLLFINEGYQVALIGVKDLFEVSLTESYPHAARIRNAVFEGENKLPRLFLGQSFLVVFATFIISQLTSFKNFPYHENIPNWIVDIFARTGFAGVLLTVNVAQLLPSILAQKYPAAFLQYTPLVYPTIWLALGIESIGIVYCTYVIVYLFEKMYFGNSAFDESNREPTDSTCNFTLVQNRVKCVLSCLLTVASAGFVCYSIAMGYSILELSPSALFACLILMYILIFYCEGSKIAIVTCSTFTREELVERNLPTIFYDLLTSEKMWDGTATFLLGRQMLVVPSGFFIAQITFFTTGHETLNPVLYYLLVGLGIPGMLVTMQLAQLAPQILANRHPKQFLALPGAGLLVRIALLIEQLGLTRCAFVLRNTVECIAGNSCRFGDSPYTKNTNVDDEVESPSKRDRAPLLDDEKVVAV